MASTTQFRQAFSQAKVRSAGAHTNANSQQPANAAGGGGGGTGVIQLLAGTGLGVSPAGGTGVVTASLGTREAVHNYLNQYQLYVDDYIAAASGATLTGINNAIAAINTTGFGALIFGPGAYTVNGAVTAFTCGVKVVGQGSGVTSITQQAANTGLFQANTGSQCWFGDMNLVGAGSGGTGNYGIELTNSNSDSIIRDCEIQGWATGVRLTSAINMTFVSGNTISGNNYGVEIAGGSGTPTVMGNVMNNTTANIYNNSATGGGDMIIGNYLDGAEYGVLYTAPNSNSIDLYITGNHIEDYSVGGVFIQPGGSSSVFQNVVIVGNEFADESGTTGASVQVSSSSVAGAWVNNMTISGNTMGCAIGSHCVALYYTTNAVITGNAFGCRNGTTALYIDSTCSGVRRGTNVFNTTTTNITDSQTWNVAALPPAASNLGERRFVSDATATTFASNVAGGGANWVPVISNGANWIIG